MLHTEKKNSFHSHKYPVREIIHQAKEEGRREFWKKMKNLQKIKTERPKDYALNDKGIQDHSSEKT